MTSQPNPILIFLLQFFLLLVSAKLLGSIFLKIKQPTVTADLIVGLLFGPSILGRFYPNIRFRLFPSDPFQIAMLDTIAWLGILFLLLVTGLEVNFSSIWKQKDKALWIALSDIILPVIISFSVLFFLPDRYLSDPDRRILFTLFLSTIMTISAMPISIRVMTDLKLLRTDLGFLTISALSINDVIGWVVFTIILGIFTSGRPDFPYVIGLVFFTFLFTITALTAGKFFIDKIITSVRARTIDYSGFSLTIVCLVGLAFGVITEVIGIHSLFGFFLAGLIAGEARDLTEKTRSTISEMVNAIFVPIFFANIGLKIDIIKHFDLLLVLLFTTLGIGARFIGAYAGTIFSRVPKSQRMSISALHTPGGEMHIVIATLALGLQLINDQVFVAIIIAAVLSSMTLGPWLTWIVKRMIAGEAVQIQQLAAMELLKDEKYGALEEICMRAAHLSSLDEKEVFGAVRNREETMSTGIGQGLALPHARFDTISSPMIVFGRSISGIDWNTPDGQPAKLIFLILTPIKDPNSQIRIYRQLIQAATKTDIRESIIDSPSIEKARLLINDTLFETTVQESAGRQLRITSQS